MLKCYNREKEAHLLEQIEQKSHTSAQMTFESIKLNTWVYQQPTCK